MASSNAERLVDWDQLYPGRFWKAGLLGPNERKVLTISDIVLEEMITEQGQKMKGVISFSGDPLALPLNKTNGICLREMFGRVPYKWIGKRFAMFATEWAGEPCIRIWGSPDIADDMVLTIQLPRKKPFKMTMHAMGDAKSLDRAAGAAAKKLQPVQRPPLSDRCSELLKLMAGAATDEDLTDIEADFASETFGSHEGRVLAKALLKRREQLAALALAAEQHHTETDDDDIIR